MAETAAIVAAALLAALALFQAALAGGAPLGRFAWGGQHRVLPTGLRIGSAIAILIYLAIALVLLERAEVTSMFDADDAIAVLTWVIVAFFTLGIVMNGISRSRPERFTMTPLVIALAILSLMVAAAA